MNKTLKMISMAAVLATGLAASGLAMAGNQDVVQYTVFTNSPGAAISATDCNGAKQNDTTGTNSGQGTLVVGPAGCKAKFFENEKWPALTFNGDILDINGYVPTVMSVSAMAAYDVTGSWKPALNISVDGDCHAVPGYNTFSKKINGHTVCFEGFTGKPS